MDFVKICVVYFVGKHWTFSISLYIWYLSVLIHERWFIYWLFLFFETFVRSFKETYVLFHVSLIRILFSRMKNTLLFLFDIPVFNRPMRFLCALFFLIFNSENVYLFSIHEYDETITLYLYEHTLIIRNCVKWRELFVIICELHWYLKDKLERHP